MSNAVREGREIIFADGQKRTIYPLTIRQLRKFMKAAKGLDKVENEELTDEQVDKMIEAAAIALEKDYPAEASDIDALEDLLDLKSFNALLSAAMGTDPNV